MQLPGAATPHETKAAQQKREAGESKNRKWQAGEGQGAFAAAGSLLTETSAAAGTRTAAARRLRR
jgi:hypothetical protein